MKLYIQYVDGVWGESQYRDDFETLEKAVYNAQGWYDFEPTPLDHIDIDYVATFERYLDVDSVVRYKWATVRKTGNDLVNATRDKWGFVRAVRKGLLEQSDYTQLPDAALSAEMKQAWVVYRQALRDITANPDPFTIEWPVSPDGFAVPIGVSRV